VMCWKEGKRHSCACAVVCRQVRLFRHWSAAAGEETWAWATARSPQRPHKGSVRAHGRARVAAVDIPSKRA